VRGVRRVLVETEARFLASVAGHLLTAPNMMCGQYYTLARDRGYL
jgi:hypothetical protein